MSLLTKLDELRRYVRIEAKDFPVAIELNVPAAEKGVAALLGPTLYAWLLTQYEAGLAPTDAGVPAQLLRLVQAPIARLSTAWALDEHQAKISNTGVQITSTQTEKTAFQWQVKDLRDTLEARGYNDLDTLVEWLEANHDELPELRAWAASAAGQRHRRELFTGTADFQEYTNIYASRRTFVALGSIRRRVESFELVGVLGDEFLAELREQVRTRTLSSDNENLLRSYVYPALAELSIAQGIPELGLRLSGDGVELDIRRRDKNSLQLSDSALLAKLLDQKMHSSLDAGGRYLRQLRSHLDRSASATRFATYFRSPAYTAPGTPAPTSTETRTARFF